MHSIRPERSHLALPQNYAIVITIDGPAGAGKSTVAKRLADSLGFEFLDTGAMYRCVTYAALTQGVDLKDPEAIFDLAKNLSIDLQGTQAFLNGENVSDAIRTPEVGQSIAAIADNVRVRGLLSDWQREWSKGRCVVTEGRDQGSEVFQDSPCKIFMVASSQERAKRRQEELATKGIQVDWEEILQQQNRRDQQDRSRPVGALRKAPDAVEFSTDGLTLAEVVEHLLLIIKNRLGLDEVHKLRSLHQPSRPAESTEQRRNG